MLLNFILLAIVLTSLILLIRQVRKNKYYVVDKLIPECNFSLSKVIFEIDGNKRTAKYSVSTKNKDRYFRDFPLGFKFYSKDKFRTKIRITYKISDDDEIEVIYDKVVEFDLTNNIKEHIYYINDVIIGSIDIEIYTESQYGKPTILFELLQNNMCHINKEIKLEIIFPN